MFISILFELDLKTVAKLHKKNSLHRQFYIKSAEMTVIIVRKEVERKEIRSKKASK